MDGDSKPSSQDAVDSIVLEEEIDPNYVPSEPEVVEYAKWMGMDLDKDQDLFWIAREGLMAPLPKDWKPCRTKDTEDIYYFNFSTGDSTWDHPCDGYYKRLYEEEKKKKETVIKESGDQNRTKAKQDVEQLLGKADKKKSKKVPRTLSDIDQVKALPTPLSLQKAPLPGINNPLRMSAPSNLGPLAGGGGGGGMMNDTLGSIKAPNTLRHSDADMKVTLGLDGLRSLPSRDASPLGRLPLDAADPKSAVQSTQQRVEQTDKVVESKDSVTELEQSMGRLDVTSSLSSKSRVLTGTSKVRAALPGSSDRSDDWHHSRSENKFVDNYDAEKIDRAPSNQSSVDRVSRTTPHPSSASVDAQGQMSSASALNDDIEHYKSKCAELERRADENEARVTDYKASYNAAKEDLLTMERRYETNQSQWMDRVRLLEVEKDKVESERRQLKLTLLDLESATKLPSTSETTLENEQLRREISELKLQIQSAEASLARSIEEQAELRRSLHRAEDYAQERISKLEVERSIAVREKADLILQLEECQRSLDKARSAVVAPVDAVHDQSEVVARHEAEVQQLQALLVEEKCQHAAAQELLIKLESSGEGKRLLDEKTEAALQLQLSNALATLAATRAELEVQGTSASATERVHIHRAEMAEAQLKDAQTSIQELQAVTLTLRSELSEKDKKLSDQQEQLLNLQASNNLNTSTDNEKSAQFEVFVSQATAIRKSLKSEIDRQRAQLLELESEKSSLVTQLTRQETTLQFAKKELNASASLNESNRVLEAENQQLRVQLDTIRASSTNASASLNESNRVLEAENQQLRVQLDTIRSSSTRHAEQEFQLREKYDKLLQIRHEEEELQQTLRQENARLAHALDQERTLGNMSEKKIKSYQEELLQLQRRLAETTSPHKAIRNVPDGLVSIDSASPASPTHFLVPDNPVVLLDLQAQLALKQTELERISQQLMERTAQLEGSEEQKRQSQRVADALSLKVSNLQEQLRSNALLISDIGSDQANAHNAGERDQLEQEKLDYEKQLQSLHSQLSVTKANLIASGVNVERLEAEIKNYRGKWLVCEKELTDARLLLSVASAGNDASLDSLRAELRAAVAAAEFSKAAEDSMRSQVAALRKALEEQDSVMKNLRADTLKTAVVATENKENFRMQSVADLSSEPIFAPRPDSHVQRDNSSQQHIVALSLEVGRQQATMERLEQHIRNTEVVLQEIKHQGSKNRATDSAVFASRSTPTTADRAEDAERESSTPDSQQSLLQSGHATSRGDLFRSSPVRKIGSRQRTGKSVQFQFVGKEKDHRRAANSDFAAPDLVDIVDIKDKISALIEEMDMDVHDCTTLSGWTRGDEASKALRVLAEGKARLKNETKFLREVQTICLAAKEAISHNQECVKSLKAAWRNARNSTSGHAISGMTTENVNSVTLKVNGAVDELRETQQLIKARENRIKSLHQSVEYLEQLTHSTGEKVDATHLIEIMELVQQKCVESAAELEALTAAFRAKGRSTITAGDKPVRRGARSAQGVAFSEARRTRADIVLEDHTTRSAVPTGVSPAIYDTYHPAHAQYLSVSSPRDFSNLPIPMYSTAPPHKPTSMPVSVSGMRNSELKNRILQDQIAKITERQSISKAVCEKHAGWLSDLGKEISGAAHGANANAATARSTTDSFASSLQNYKAKHSTLPITSTDAQHRTFGTSLQNHPHQSSTINELLEKL